MDSVTLLSSDSEYLKEDEIGRAMAELQTLRAELKIAEEDLANVLSKLETELLTLKNTVHVKRIMFEHLKGQLKTTREEWAQAYEDYQATDKRRKEELARRSQTMEEIRKQIEEVGARVRTRVGDLDLKKMSEF
jgi:chromosome segregation ATPase